jgi:hypothetical protein
MLGALRDCGRFDVASMSTAMSLTDFGPSKRNADVGVEAAAVGLDIVAANDFRFGVGGNPTSDRVLARADAVKRTHQTWVS